MAIEAGNKVSTTGLVNKRPFTPKAPDMSKMKVPEAMKAKRVKPTESKIAPPQQAPKPTEEVANKIQSLTDEDKIVLDTPSNNPAFSKKDDTADQVSKMATQSAKSSIDK